MATGASLLLFVATAVSGMEGTLFGIPGNISQCTVGCIAASGSHDGCRPPIDTKCVCGNPLFTQVTLPCVEDQCTADDVDTILQLYVDFCVSSSCERCFLYLRD
ncbi:hypothetical protein C2E23DRAFT_461637 [Lenzites betulinus]|nr:hypothetical protein C2E23DRAFT_461637 [Lenzites betulinus]